MKARETAYFTEFGGQRGAVLIVDLPDLSKVPSLAEPWFLIFQADVEPQIITRSHCNFGRASRSIPRMIDGPTTGIG
ncbi:MAG: hypothetical protein ABSG04_14485 [Verrucomicrobiota bacterium]